MSPSPLKNSGGRFPILVFHVRNHIRFESPLRVSGLIDVRSLRSRNKRCKFVSVLKIFVGNDLMGLSLSSNHVRLERSAKVSACNDDMRLLSSSSLVRDVSPSKMSLSRDVI